MAWSGASGDWRRDFVADRRAISLSERRDGALAGAFFGLLGGVLFLVLALGVALVGWWKESATSAGGFLLAQLAYVPVIIIGVAALGFFWSVRRSGAGRVVLWMIGAALTSGALLSLRKGPIWSWDLSTWRWLLLLTPAFAWALGSGGARPRTES